MWWRCWRTFRDTTRASQAIVFEPNPLAVAILQVNVRLNGLHRTVDLSYAGIGLSDVPGSGTMEDSPGNMGAARVIMTDAPGGAPLMRGDSLLVHRPIDFIKLDVEGMEMRGLLGLASTIATWRPPLFIEVDPVNAELYPTRHPAHDYVTATTYQRYTVNKNYLVIPAEAAEMRRRSPYDRYRPNDAV